MSISKGNVYTNRIYLIEMSLSNSTTIYEKSISNRKVYTKSIYLIGMSISMAYHKHTASHYAF